MTAKVIAGWAGLTSGGDHHFILKQRGCGLAHLDVAFVGIVARGAHHEHKEPRLGVPLQPDVQCGHQPDEYHEVRLKPVHIRDQHIRGLLELLGAQQLKLFLVPGPVVRSAQRKVIVELRPSLKSLLQFVRDAPLGLPRLLPAPSSANKLAALPLLPELSRVPEAPNRTQYRIASTDRHLISMGTK